MRARSRSIAGLPNIPTWCWGTTPCGAASTVPTKPIPAFRAQASISMRLCSPAVLTLPEARYGTADLKNIEADRAENEADALDVATVAERSIREGSYFIGKNTALMQMVDGKAVTITIRKGRSSEGVPEKHARIIRKLIPIRDAVREVLKLQECDRPWKPAQVKLRIAWSNFVRAFGPINFTTVSTTEDEESGEVRGISAPPEPPALPRRSRRLAGRVDRGL